MFYHGNTEHSPFFVLVDKGKSSNVFTCLENVSKFEENCCN